MFIFPKNISFSSNHFFRILVLIYLRKNFKIRNFQRSRITVSAGREWWKQGKNIFLLAFFNSIISSSAESSLERTSLDLKSVVTTTSTSLRSSTLQRTRTQVEYKKLQIDSNFYTSRFRFFLYSRSPTKCFSQTGKTIREA